MSMEGSITIPTCNLLRAGIAILQWIHGSF